MRLLALLALVVMGGAALAQEAKPVSLADRDPALKKLVSLAGHNYTGYLNPAEKKGLVEASFELGLKGNVVRSHAIIMKGTPQEFETEALYGWDPVAKKAFYYDFHGEMVFHGTVTLTDANTITSLFEVVVGQAAKFKSTDEWRHDGSILFTLFAENEGAWVKRFTLELKPQG